MFFFFNDTATTEIYTYLHTLSLHDALPIWIERVVELPAEPALGVRRANLDAGARPQPVIGVDAKDTADLIGAVDRGRGRHIARGRYADVQLRSDDIVQLGAPTRALEILVNADVGLGPDVRQARRSGQPRPDGPRDRQNRTVHLQPVLLDTRDRQSTRLKSRQ